MNEYKSLVFVATLAILSFQLLARIGESEAEIEARYGKPVSQTAYRNVDRNSTLPDFAENFREDGTPKDLPQDDGLKWADSRLMFFNTETSKWEDLRSHVIGQTSDNQETDNARKHLRQRFYVVNDIGISVVYLDGLSVSEAYHQKNKILGNDSVKELIKKSFPDCIVDDGTNLIRILSPDSTELRGCATGNVVLTLSATSYFGFLKAMEVSLIKDTEIQQKSKLNGF